MINQTLLNIFSIIIAHFVIKDMESRTPIKFTTRVLYLVLGLVIGWQTQSCSFIPNSVPAPATFESKVRQWASGYPADLRDRWAWCYLDSVENWSTDEKLREDVRLKSVQVLTDADREVLSPLDRQITDAVPKQKTELVETYQAVGLGLKVTPWSPPPDGGVRRQESGDREEPPEPVPRPIIRRGIFRR